MKLAGRMAIVILIAFAGCAEDLSTSGPSGDAAQAPPSTAVTSVRGEWISTPNFHYARSGWFDFISVEAMLGDLPDSLLVALPDSIMVVNHSDRDTAYVGGGLEGSYSSPLRQLYGDCYKKFTFPDGYVDRLPFFPDLSVYVKYR